MNIINTYSNKRFTLNGVQYLKNYISKVSGNRIAVYNCYDNKDTLVEADLYSNFVIDGITYGSAAATQEALIDVIYSRGTLGTDVGELIQDNIHIVKIVSILSTDSEANILDKINALPLYNVDQYTTVYFNCTDGADRQIIYSMVGLGKGSYGTSGTQLTAENLIKIYEYVPGTVQNNETKYISFGKINQTDFNPLPTSEIANLFNTSIAPITISETQIPWVQVTVSGASQPSVKHIYQFLPGKGNYGSGGATVTASMFRYVNTLGATQQDIENTGNTETINLGEVTNYITALNSVERDFTDENLQYFVKYTISGTSYFKIFIGTTYGMYGGTNTLQFTDEMWQDVVTSTVPGNAGVSLVSGTANRITVSNGSTTPVIDIDSAYTTARDTYATTLVNQVIDGAPAEYNTLNKIAVKLSAISSLVGSTGADADNIVNTVAEILSVFQNYPEGLNLLTALTGKVNATDIVNNLTQVASGKPLDAAQGKVLKDLIDSNTTAIAGKLNAGANAGLSGTNTRVGLILPNGTVTFNTNMVYDASTGELTMGSVANPHKYTIVSSISRLKVLTNITSGNAFHEVNANQESAYAFKDTQGETYWIIRSLEGKKALIFPLPCILDQKIFHPITPVQAKLTSDGAGVRVYGKDSVNNDVTVPFLVDGNLAFFEITFMLKNSTASQVIAGKFKAIAKRTSAGGGTISIVQQTTEFVSNNSTYPGAQVGIEAVSNTAVRFYFTPDVADSTAYTGAFQKIEYTFN